MEQLQTLNIKTASSKKGIARQSRMVELLSGYCGAQATEAISYLQIDPQTVDHVGSLRS